MVTAITDFVAATIDLVMNQWVFTALLCIAAAAAVVSHYAV
jgi:hypothetical protein